MGIPLQGPGGIKRSPGDSGLVFTSPSGSFRVARQPPEALALLVSPEGSAAARFTRSVVTSSSFNAGSTNRFRLARELLDHRLERPANGLRDSQPHDVATGYTRAKVWYVGPRVQHRHRHVM